MGPSALQSQPALINVHSGALSTLSNFFIPVCPMGSSGQVMSFPGLPRPQNTGQFYLQNGISEGKTAWKKILSELGQSTPFSASG